MLSTILDEELQAESCTEHALVGVKRAVGSLYLHNAAQEQSYNNILVYVWTHSTASGDKK